MKEKIEELQEMAKKLEDRRNKVLATIEYLKKMSETKICPLCGKEFKPKKNKPNILFFWMQQNII